LRHDNDGSDHESRRSQEHRGPSDVGARGEGRAVARPADSLGGPWVFSNEDGGPLDITSLRERVWRPAIRRAKLRARTLYQTRHTFATLMFEAGESPGRVARQRGHTNAEMVYRRYHSSSRTREAATALT
jgi:integrase